MKTLLLSSITAIAALATPVQLAAAEDKSSEKQRQNASQSGSKESRDSKGTKVALKELPQPVQKTFRTEAGHLNIENVQKLNKNGQTCYTGTFDKSGLQSRLTVAEDGSLLQLQQAANIALVRQAPPLGGSEIKLSELPESVQSRVEQVAGTNKVGEISKVNESGKTLYTAAFNDAGVHTELILDEEGELVLRTDQTALFAAPLVSSQPVSIQSAPEAVQNTIQQQASAKKVADIDKGQWNGKTAYRVMIEKNGSARPMLISESGEILQAPGTATGAPATTEQGQEQRERAKPRAQGDASAREGDGEVLGLPTSNNDGTILGVIPAPSRVVEAGNAQESYVAEELADGKVNKGVDNVFEGDQDAVAVPSTSERDKAAGEFLPDRN